MKHSQLSFSKKPCLSTPSVLAPAHKCSSVNRMVSQIAGDGVSLECRSYIHDNHVYCMVWTPMVKRDADAENLKTSLIATQYLR